jgi:hypothetical protein
MPLNITDEIFGKHSVHNASATASRGSSSTRAHKLNSAPGHHLGVQAVDRAGHTDKVCRCGSVHRIVPYHSPDECSSPLQPDSFAPHHS